MKEIRKGFQAKRTAWTKAKYLMSLDFRKTTGHLHGASGKKYQPVIWDKKIGIKVFGILVSFLRVTGALTSSLVEETGDQIYVFQWNSRSRSG